MATTTNILLANRTHAQGTITIVPTVLEVLLGLAASQVDGVYQMRGNLGSSLNAWFGRANHGKGDSDTVAEHKITAHVYVYLDYGVSVPKVHLAMQEQLREQLLLHTDLTLDTVNVTVVGDIPTKTEPVNPTHLFKEHDTEHTEHAATTSGQEHT